MMDVMCWYERNWIAKTGRPSFSMGLVIVTTVLAFMKSVFVVEFEELSFKTVILRGSYMIGEDLLL